MTYDTAFYERNLKFQKSLSVKLVPFLVRKYQFTTIADFGCGCGYFLKSLAVASKAKYYHGLNGTTPENLVLRNDRFIQCDFNHPVELGKKYGLVISLEVAEHIPAESSDIFIKSITDHATKYILFSAATPGQCGVGHINEQPHEHWHKEFLKYGFQVHDTIRPYLKDKKAVPF